MRSSLAAIVLLSASALAISSPALSAETDAAQAVPDCSLVREAVRQHGKTKAYVWAVSQGYSHRAIAQVRRTCGV